MIPVLSNINKTIPENVADGFIVLLNKEAGWSSFDVVRKIKNALKFKKVGHAGTLDPFAEGLLMLGIGKGTKQLHALSMESKSYITEVCFGKTTDSYDKTGNIMKEEDPSKVTLSDIKAALDTMKGDVFQLPPMFSAKKVNGVRLYKMARKGVEVERKHTKITIFETEILNWNSPILKLFLNVSKGTYIRSYGYDLGEKLGCGAYLQSLQRVSIGEYKVENSFYVNEFVDLWKSGFKQ
jgi:tRNA pseudouridine55 synthase